jgi:hypothetical protein
MLDYAPGEALVYPVRRAIDDDRSRPRLTRLGRESPASPPKPAPPPRDFTIDDDAMKGWRGLVWEARRRAWSGLAAVRRGPGYLCAGR